MNCNKTLLIGLFNLRSDKRTGDLKFVIQNFISNLSILLQNNAIIMVGSNGPVQMFKYGYSCILLIFSIVLIVGLIFNKQTRLSQNTHPVVALVVLLISVVWLTMVEGGQGALVGLGPVDSELYKDSHPLTHKCTSFVFKGDNLNRYLIGRQFMVILIVFIVELSGASHGGDHGHGLWGIPEVLINIFLVSGVAMILFTCMVGQLNSEIIGCHYMLDYRKFFLMFTHILCNELVYTSSNTNICS